MRLPEQCYPLSVGHGMSYIEAKTRQNMSPQSIDHNYRIGARRQCHLLTAYWSQWEVIAMGLCVKNHVTHSLQPQDKI
jgi:hypothetical protein